MAHRLAQGELGSFEVGDGRVALTLHGREFGGCRAECVLKSRVLLLEDSEPFKELPLAVSVDLVAEVSLESASEPVAFVAQVADLGPGVGQLSAETGQAAVVQGLVASAAWWSCWARMADSMAHRMVGLL
ncbi:hypothetical protein [Branchiibius cervicis]|uniref:NIF system FeS cluster assembly NifU N-terminal domain-containing protein n=1 Tax=Branchiibius cervicis TaxID=908252 RepID=A0ABW2AT85_9MICO